MKYNKKALWFIVLAVFISVLFILAAYYYYSYEKKRVQENKHAELSAIGKLKTDQFRQWHQERLSEAHFFSGTPSFVSSVEAILEGDTSGNESLRKSLLHIMTNKRYENIYVLDSNNKIVFSAINTALFLDPVSLKYCERVVSTGQLSIRDYYYCPHHESIHYKMFAPVKNETKRTVAVMVFSINPNDFIYPLLSDWPNKSKTSETILVRDEGDSIRYLSLLQRIDNSKLSLTYSNNETKLPAVQVFQGNTGLYQGLDYAGENVLVDLSLIPLTNYALINKIDIDELYADFYKQTTMIALITALSILLVALIVAWFYSVRQRVLYRKLLANRIKLEESEEQYRLIMDNSLDGIMLTAPDGRIFTANKAAQQMFGRSEKEICERGREGLVDTSDPNLKRLMEERKRTGKTKGELTFIHKNGSKIPAEITSSVFKSASGEILNGMIIRDISERKKAELELIYERKLLRTLIDSLPDSIFVKDMEGRKIIANRADLIHMGIQSEKEALGKTDIELFNNIDGHEGYLEDMAVVQSQKAIYNKEVSFVDIDGKKKWQLVSKVPLLDHNNQLKGIVGFSHDFTRRKEMELQLQYSEETIRLLFNSTAEGIYGLDSKGRCIFCNRAAINLLGYEKEEELLGKDMHVLINYPSKPKHDECKLRETYLHGEKKHSEDDLFKKKNGTALPVEFWSYPIERNNKVIGAVVTFVDITQRKQHQQEQKILYRISRESMLIENIEELILLIKKQLETALDATNFYVASYNRETNTLKQIIFINETITSDEWSAEDTLSGRVIKSGKSLLACEEEIAEFYASRKIDPDYRMAKCWLGVPLKQGEEMKGVMVVQSYHNEHAYNQQHRILLEMIAHELEIVMQRNKMINDLIAAKNKAEESDRLKSAFLANVSHEIRTPMNGILGFLELLTEHDLSDDKKELYLNIMNKSGHRLLETINDIIELSKIESGQLVVNLSEVNVEELMNFHYNFFLPKASEKGLVLEIEQTAGDATTFVYTDKVKLNGMFTNIVNNALKYTDEGTIQIGCYFENESLVFYVRDTGIGIPMEKQESIFQRFNQVDNMLTRQKEGAGLGLSIVQAYIQIMHGKIWLESEPGKGSCFYFSIPLLKN